MPLQDLDTLLSGINQKASSGLKPLDQVTGFSGDTPGKLDRVDIQQGVAGVKEAFGGLGGRIKETFTGEVEKGGRFIEEGVEKFKSGEPIEGAAKIVTGGIKAGISPVTGVLGGIAEPGVEPVAKGFGGLIEGGLKKRLGEEEGAAAFQKLKTDAFENLADLKKAYDELPSNQKTAVDLGIAGVELFTTIEGGRAVGKTGSELLETGIEQAPKVLKAGQKVAGEVGGVIEESGEAALKAERSAFARELATPVQTKKVKEAQVRRTTETGIGPFKKSEIAPSPQEAKVQEVLIGIDEIKPGITDQQAFNIANKEITKTAKELEEGLLANDFIFPKKELKSRLNASKARLAENPTLTGDAEKTAQKLIDKFDKFVEDGGAKGSSLLKARKDYDKWVKSQKPKAFDAKTEGAFEVANREIRQTVNDFLDEKAVTIGVKDSLAKQSTLFNALETLTPKAAIEADTAIGRALQRAGKILGTKNKAVQATAAAVGIGGLGAAATFAPAVAALFGTGIALRGAKGLITNPKLRVAIGKLLKQLDTVDLPKGVKPAEVKALKQDISGMLGQ